LGDDGELPAIVAVFNQPAASRSAVMLIRRPNKNTGKTKSFPQSHKMISPTIDANTDSDIIQPVERNAKHLVRKRTMSYSKACEILGYTTPKSVDANARLARIRLSVLPVGSPLRYAVACDVLIKAAR
jgi:hypothetical protein